MLAAFTAYEEVGVVSRAGDESQNLSCGRLDGHDGSDLADHELFAVGLQFSIQTEIEVFTSYGFLVEFTVHEATHLAVVNIYHHDFQAFHTA